MIKFHLESAVCNHKGNVRTNNEDSFYLNGQFMPLDKMDEGGCFSAESDQNAQLYAVCDGMGGESAGENASFAAVRALHAMQADASGTITDATLTQCLHDVSVQIYQEAHAHGIRSGTTFAGCLWQNGQMRVAHIGDSRVYRLHDGRLEQLTADHSEVQRLVAMGVITSEEAKTHPKRHVISQYLGMPADEVSVSPTLSPWYKGTPHDRYIICSDGLTDMLDNAGIEQILAKAEDAKSAAIGLVQGALRKGGRDNVTVLCLNLLPHKRGKQWTPVQLVLLGGGLITAILSALFIAELFFRL